MKKFCNFKQGNGEVWPVWINSDTKRKFGSLGYMWIVDFGNGSAHYMDAETIEKATGFNPTYKRNWSK